jgi:hypothetical protein
MTKQEIIVALEKAKRQLAVAKEQDEKDFAQKKVTKLQSQLADLSDAITGSPNTVDLLAKIEKAKRQLAVAKEQDEKDFAQKKLTKLQQELSGISDVSKTKTEFQAENKEILKEVETVKKNETIPTEIKPKLVAKIKEEVNKVMLDEKKAVREVEKAKTKPKKAQAKQKLAEVKERKAEVKELVVKVSKKHESPQKFRDLLKRLTDTGKYDFLKSMSKDEILRDMKRVAKPMGWRFRGKGNYKNPNRTEIKAGVKSGAVYYETRPEHSDVSKTVRLAKGGMIGTNKANEFSKGKYVWVREQGGITDIVLSQSAFEELFEEMKAKLKLEMDEPKFKVFSKENGSILQLKLKEIYS